MNRRRDSFHIMEDILRAADSPRGALKTHLVCKANLNFIRLEQYLDLLMDKGLVEVQGLEYERYYTTSKGREFLSQVIETRSFLVAVH